jgi:hypothetical protein
MDTNIPLSSKRLLSFSPKTLEGSDLETTVSIRIPTPSERDNLSGRMFELGLRAIAAETFRATQISELYKIDWASVEAWLHVPRDLRSKFTHLPGPDEVEAWKDEVADTLAQKLDDFWLRQSADDQAMQQWLEQEAERIRDEFEGADPRPPYPVPHQSLTPRLKAEVKLLTDFQTEECQAYRRLLVTNMSWNQANAEPAVPHPPAGADRGRRIGRRRRRGSSSTRAGWSRSNRATTCPRVYRRSDAWKEIVRKLRQTLSPAGDRKKKLRLAAREAVRPDWFATTERRLGDQRWELDGTRLLHTAPSRRIRDDHRFIVRYAFRQRSIDGGRERWPDRPTAG